MSRPEDVRLYAILARDAPRGVLFRRGPSKQVLLIRWNTADDTFEEGQWLKGRIYERRSDLSPDGELLIYFAASQKPPYGTWTAVSRPPYLTALALWPKGDTWGGGGRFETNDHILLNHGSVHLELASGFELPKQVTIGTFRASGRGEDEPIWYDRLRRAGWELKTERVTTSERSDAGVLVAFDPPVTWEKPRDDHVLRMMITGIKQTNGPWYVIEHTVVDKSGHEVLSLGRSDWADWDRNGDLLVARDGKLLRFEDVSRPPRLLADFADRKFEQRAPPPAALVWPRKWRKRKKS